MPFTDQEKREILLGNGFNPDEYTMTDDGRARKIIKAQPSITNTPTAPLTTKFEPLNPAPQSDTPWQTFVKSAEHSALPALLGGAGTGLGLMAATALGFTGVGAPAAVAIGGGLLGAYGGEKIQEDVSPEGLAEMQALAESQAANPKAAFAGNLATMPLAGFGGIGPSGIQSIKNIGLTGRALPRLLGLTSGAATPIEKAAALNVGMGTGLGAALPVAHSLVANGELPPLQDVLTGAAANLAFNEPNVLGRKLFGFHPTIASVPKVLPDEANVAILNPQPTVELNPPEGSTILPKDELMFNTTGQTYVPGKKGEVKLVPGKTTLSEVGPAEDSALAILKAKEEGQAEIRRQDLYEVSQETLQKQIDHQKAVNEIRAEEIRRAKQQAEELRRQNDAAQQRVAIDPVTYVGKAPDLTTGIELGSAVKRPEVVDTALGKEPQQVTELETFADKQARQTEARLSGENPADVRYSPESEMKQKAPIGTEFTGKTVAKLREIGVNPNPTASWKGYWKNFMEWKRNITVKDDGKVINDATGKEVAGKTYRNEVGKLVNEISSTDAGLDTHAHEGMHGFIDSIRGTKMYKRFEQLVSESPEFADINARRVAAKEPAWTPEEYIATEQGYEFLNRNLKLRGETEFKTWWRDFVSDIKVKYGKKGTATNEDFRRLLQYKFQYDKATGPEPTFRGAPIQRNQDESEAVQQWRRNNNRTATGEYAQEYNLPEGVQYSDLNVFTFREDAKAIDSMYNKLVELNPELKTINVDGEYNGVFSAKADVVRGVASKFKVDNIKYFVEDLQGSLHNKPGAKVVQNHVVRNQDESQLKQKPADEDWQVTVQPEHPEIPGTGYVQIDDITGGQNRWSKGKESLTKEGYDVPDFSKLPGGKYKYEDALKMLPKHSDASEMRHRSGANINRSMEIFGNKMYDKKPSVTTVKELVANAHDAFSGITDENYPRQIQLDVDTTDESLKFTDNGTGMTPEVVVDSFLQAYSSGKTGVDTIGNYGLAKIGFLGGSKEFHVETTSKLPNGQMLKTEVIGDGKSWLKFVDAGADLPVDINKPGRYALTPDSNLEMIVRAESPDANTGTSITVKPKEFDSYDARSTFRGLAQYAKLNTKYKLNVDGYHIDVNRSLEKFAPLQEFETPGANVSIKMDHSSPKQRQTYIPILSNGLKQFDLYYGKDVKMPSIIIEVTPRVGVLDGGYPYSTNRDSLHGSTSKAVQDALENIASTYKIQEHAKYTDTLKQRSKIKGVGTDFLDLTGNLTPDIRNEIAANHNIVTLNKILKSIHREIFGYLNNSYGNYWSNAKFKGLTHGGEHAGVRFGVPDKGEQGDIYYNINGILTRVNANRASGLVPMHEAFAEELGGVVLHEVSHQISFDEGQTHAEAMTDIAGKIAVQLVKLRKKVIRLYENEQNFNEFHNWYAEQTRVDESSSSDIDDIIRKAQSQAAEPNKGVQIIGDAGAVNTGKGGATRYSEGSELLGDGDSFMDKFNKNENDPGMKKLDKVANDAFNNAVELDSIHNNPMAAYNEMEVSRKADAIAIDMFNGNLERNSEKSEMQSYKASFAPFLTARFDKIAENIKTPTARMVTDNLNNFAQEQDILTGQIGNKLIATGKEYSDKEQQRVYRYAHQMSIDGDSAMQLTGREKNLFQARLKVIQDARKMQNDLGLKVKSGEEFRLGGIDPKGYMFSVINPEVAYTWAENPNSVKSKAYDTAYIKHMTDHGMSGKEALEALVKYKGALGSNTPKDIEFGALRKAAGLGLPWELVEQNFNSAAMRYARRAAKDLAYFKWIQNDPKMLKALNRRDQFGNLPDQSVADGIENIQPNEATKQAMRSVDGVSDATINPRTMAWARSAVNTVLGPGTAIRNIVNMPSFIATYVQLHQLPKVFKAFAHMNESRVRAFENNAVRASFADYDAAGYYLGNPNPTIRLLNRYSEGMRKYQGRNLSDTFEGEYYYSLGELLATSNIAEAKAGNKESKMFVKKFASTVEGGAEGLLKRKVTQDDINRMAKSLVDHARGSYGPTGLPSFAIEGQIAPFFSLNRFAIEKANTVYKDVILPAKQGIYGPLVRYVLGSAGVGFAIEELNALLSNKRGSEPTINELLASGDESDLLPKAISTMQLASFAGIVSDGAQLVSNAARGKGFSYNNPISFPLYTLMTDTLGRNIADAATAMKEGEDPFEVLAKLSVVLSTQSVQGMRYLDAHVLHPEEAKRKEKFRDYNLWQEMTGRKEPDSPVISNQFKNMASKEYKKETDPQEAVKMLPDLIRRTIEKSKNNQGRIDPVKLGKNFTGLKLNSYQVMPALENDPVAFTEYYEHIRKSQGEAKAKSLMIEFMRQREVNKVKNSLIPSF